MSAARVIADRLRIARADTQATLPFATFIGRRGRALAVPGFSLVEMTDRAEEHVPQHSHRDAHFLYVIDGTYLTTARGGNGACSPGTLIFNPAGTTHRDRFHTRGGSFLTVSIGDAGKRAVALERAQLVRGRAVTAVASMRRELDDSDAWSALAIEGLALELLACAMREVDTRGRPPWLVRAHEQIADRCTEPVTIAEVAHDVGVHPAHLARAFRAHFRCTPAAFARQCQIARAATLLASTRRPIAAIACAVGFADQSAFTKAFRRITGTTPASYRRR